MKTNGCNSGWEELLRPIGQRARHLNGMQRRHWTPLCWTLAAADWGRWGWGHVPSRCPSQQFQAQAWKEHGPAITKIHFSRRLQPST